MHRLVLFAGSSLGSGKSTLSALLHQQLTAQGIPAIWLQEETLDAIFGQFAPGWQINTVEPEAFLMACAGFLSQYQQSDAALITDSVLPGYINFFGRFPTAHIEQFNTRLYQLLQPRDPLLIYLQTDIDAAFARATAQRGEQWFENIRSYLNSWRLPLYTEKPQSFAARQDVITYFTALDRLARALVSRWPGAKQVLNTTHAPLHDLLHPLLDAFGRSFHPAAQGVNARALPAYAGRYVRMTDSSAPEQLVVEVANDQLRVNTYWPIGTVLLPIDKDTFRLEATDRWIIFVRDSAGQIAGLHYRLSEQEYAYHLLQGTNTKQ